MRTDSSIKLLDTRRGTVVVVDVVVDVVVVGGTVVVVVVVDVVVVGGSVVVVEPVGAVIVVVLLVAMPGRLPVPSKLNWLAGDPTRLDDAL